MDQYYMKNSVIDLVRRDMENICICINFKRLIREKETIVDARECVYERESVWLPVSLSKCGM